MTNTNCKCREHVFGYRGLKIDLWMSAASLKAYARMNADETITLSQSEGVKPDLVLSPLVKILAEGQVTESIGAFTTEIQSDRETKFKPQGEKITEFEIHDTKDEGKKPKNYFKILSIPFLRKNRTQNFNIIIFHISI